MTPERAKKIKNVLDNRRIDLTVILDHVHKHRNHAAILRTCDAVGIQKMHVVTTEEEHRPFRGTAMGSHQWVDVVKHEMIEIAIKKIKKDNFTIIAANNSGKAIDYREVDYTQPVALVMGAEKKGVSNNALSFVDQEVFIPMYGMVESYNVSVAAAIILNEAISQRNAVRNKVENKKLTAEEYQYYFFKWGYPRLAEFCDLRNIPYPEVDVHGDIVDPEGRWRAIAKEREVLNKNKSDVNNIVL